MTVRLVRAEEQDASEIHRMQAEAFAVLLKKYRDYETNPGAEPVERVRARLMQEHTYYYYIVLGSGETVGVIRVVDGKNGDRKRIAPLFILPQYRNLGCAQAAIREAERLHGSENWFLDTIQQEKGNCHLYEKMGYRRTDFINPVCEGMTLIGYEK